MDTQTSDEPTSWVTPDRSIPCDPAAGGTELTLSREAYAMLAQANLLRMRGAWPEAIEKCMAALRLSPDHPSAQSLLGDIYENQGRLDDAIQWYRMALDVQPDSPADRIKLARLIDLKARDLAAPIMVKEDAPASVPSEPTPLRRPRLMPGWRSDPDKMLRRIAFVTGVLAILVVLTALLVAHRSLPFGGSPKQVDAPPVVVPSVAAGAATASSVDTTAAVGDPSEVSTLDALRTDASLPPQGCTVDSIQIDPRAGRMTITLTWQSPGGPSPRRDTVLRCVTGVLQSAVQRTDAQVITQYTVRCLLSSATGGSTPLVFTADASRSAVAALNPNLTLLSKDQIAATYTDLWWTPSLGQ